MSPFLAGAKLASINASRTSMPPLALSFKARAVMIFVITPERTHCEFVNPLREPLLALATTFAQNEVNVKRERLTQIVLVIVGLFNLTLIYFLYIDLRHSSWLLERKNEVEPMFLSFFIPVGVFLLMAARRPSEHRSMIALAAWWNISHGVVMAIQTVEAWIHSVHFTVFSEGDNSVAV
jgi:uncharacterized protein DUF6632